MITFLSAVVVCQFSAHEVNTMLDVPSCALYQLVPVLEVQLVVDAEDEREKWKLHWTKPVDVNCFQRSAY